MPIQVWLARMERSLTEQEYGDMMALLPDARRERLEKLPKEKHQEVLCAYLLLRMALWEQRGCAAEYGKMAMQMPWPEYDESKTVAAHTEMAVQVNGKLKGTVTVAMDSEQDAVVEAARQVEKIAKALDGMQIVKVIFVKNKLINLIVKPQ